MTRKPHQASIVHYGTGRSEIKEVRHGSPIGSCRIPAFSDTTRARFIMENHRCGGGRKKKVIDRIATKTISREIRRHGKAGLLG